MRFLKKTICLLFILFMITGLFSSIQTDASAILIPTPKIKVKTIKNSTGVKITIAKTSYADEYTLSFTGTPTNPEYGCYFKYKESADKVVLTNSFSTRIENVGNTKQIITYKNLQPGTYTVKVRSRNNKTFGRITYSEWSKEKSFTLKENAINGYNTSYDFSNVKKGDVIKFGVYEQDLDYTNGKEPIKWLVLKKTNNSILLLSKYALDMLPYTTDLDDHNETWETCTLRKWLNKDFIKSAFNKTEQEMIKKTKIKNYDNLEYKTSGGNDTKDKIFLLSQLELKDCNLDFAESNYVNDLNRRCAFAWYKSKKGNGDSNTKDGEYTCWWWSRSPGYDNNFACYVNKDGKVSVGGVVICSGLLNGKDKDDCCGVRPALYIKLKS